VSSQPHELKVILLRTDKGTSGRLLNAVVDCDLRIVPVLWKFDSHATFSTLIANPDLGALAEWLDDRIVAFVELYTQIHEDELIDKAEFVEDPVAKVKFPKFAAGATLEHGGRTDFFIDDTRRPSSPSRRGSRDHASDFDAADSPCKVDVGRQRGDRGYAARSCRSK
jgi:hypothetical protein